MEEKRKSISSGEGVFSGHNRENKNKPRVDLTPFPP
jgi:hypothetical protein